MVEREISEAINVGSEAVNAVNDTYAGVRQASQFLIDAGVPRVNRVQALQSFEIETISVKTAGTSDFGLRYYDGIEAQAKGRYLFETFPASRESLALPPEWNSMTNIQQWQIRSGSTFIEGRAASQGPFFPGGQIQRYIPNVGDLLP